MASTRFALDAVFRRLREKTEAAVVLLLSLTHTVDTVQKCGGVYEAGGLKNLKNLTDKRKAGTHWRAHNSAKAASLFTKDQVTADPDRDK